METRRNGTEWAHWEPWEPVAGWEFVAVGATPAAAALAAGAVVAALVVAAGAVPVAAAPTSGAVPVAAVQTAAAQTVDAARTRAVASAAPDLAAVAAFEGSGLAPVVDRFAADWGAVQRRWADLPYSQARQRRMADFLADWAEALDALPVAEDDLEGSIDRVLLSAEIRYRQELLAREGRLLDEVAPLLPFGGEIVELLEIRHAGDEVDGEEMAAALAGLAVVVDEADAALRSRAAAGGAGAGGAGQPTTTPIAGLRAVRVLQSYRNSLASWYRHYAGYDPLFT